MDTSLQAASSFDNSASDKEKSSEIETTNDKSNVDFSEQTGKEDFTLIVEGEKLYVSKAVLAIASPVFDQMFHSDFTEKDESDLILPGQNVSEVREFLRFIYPGISECISDENVYKLLPLAEEYQVTSLKAKCEEFLISRLNKELPADELKIMLQTAAIYNMEDLIDKFCEDLPEQSARSVISEEIPLPTMAIINILGKVMGRLEHIREKNTWLEGIYKYTTSGHFHDVQDIIERNLRVYKDWKCQSLYLQLNGDDLMRKHVPEIKKFKFLDINANLTMSIYTKGDGYYWDQSIIIDILFDEDTIKQSKVKLHGRFVIRNVIDAFPIYESTFQMEFIPSILKRSAEMKNSQLGFDVRAKYLYYCVMDAEVHLLAKREEAKQTTSAN